MSSNNHKLTFVCCCFWLRPLEGEFLLPCDAAFIPACLLLCYKYRATRRSENVYEWNLPSLFAFSLLFSYLHLRGYERWAWGVVEACQLTMGVEAGAGGGLGFDDGGEFVGRGIDSSSVGKVDESAGWDAVTTRRRTPGGTNSPRVWTFLNRLKSVRCRTRFTYLTIMWQQCCVSHFLFKPKLWGKVRV